jgi:predicted Zn-dependent peptidase
VLEADSRRHENERQVVGEELGAQRDDDDVPAGEADRYEQEPGEPYGREVLPGAAV